MHICSAHARKYIWRKVSPLTSRKKSKDRVLEPRAKEIARLLVKSSRKLVAKAARESSTSVKLASVSLSLSALSSFPPALSATRLRMQQSERRSVIFRTSTFRRIRFSISAILRTCVLPLRSFARVRVYTYAYGTRIRPPFSSVIYGK